MATCKVEDLREQDYNQIKDVVSKSAKRNLDYTPDKVLLRYGPNEAFKDLNAAYGAAMNSTHRINDWSLENYNSEYNGKWYRINKSVPGVVVMTLTTPTQIEKRYAHQVKMRNNPPLDELADTREKDEVVSIPDGYYFGPYTKLKKDLRNKVSQRLGVLREIPQPTNEHLKQINIFENLEKDLNSDIKELNDEGIKISNAFKYFKKDLKKIRLLFEQDPSIDSFNIAREYFDAMGYVLDTNTRNPDGTMMEEGEEDAEGNVIVKDGLSENYYKDIKNPDIRGQFLQFQHDLNDLKTDIDRAEELGFVELLKTEEAKSDDSAQHQDVKKLRLLSDGIDFVDFATQPVVPTSTSNILVDFGKKVYTDAMAFKETLNLRRKLRASQKRVEKRLIELGHKNKKGGILSALYSNVSFNIFFRKDVNNRTRLVGKFSDSWDEFQAKMRKFDGKLESLTSKHKRGSNNYHTVMDKRKEKYNTIINAKGKFIDPRKIPEFRDNKELSTGFRANFVKEQDSEDYKEEVIQELLGGRDLSNLTPDQRKSARDSAEKQYDKIVAEQLNNIISYQLSMEALVKKKLRERGEKHVKNLPLDDINEILLYETTHSPFKFAESNEKGTSEVGRTTFLKDGKTAMGTEPSSLEYSSYYPTYPGHYDTNFQETIENDRVLYEAWSLYSNAYSYLNKNRKYQREKGDIYVDDTMLFEYTALKEHYHAAWGVTKWASESFMNRLALVFGTTEFRKKNDMMRLKGTLKSIDEVIQQRVKEHRGELLKHGINTKIKFDPEKVSREGTKFLESILGKPVPTTMSIQRLLENEAFKEVYKEHNPNLHDSLITMLEAVEIFKAKKEVEQKMLFTRNLLRRAIDSAKPKKRRGIIEKYGGTRREMELRRYEEFIYGEVYDVNNRANWNLPLIPSTKGIKITTRRQRKRIKAAKKSIKIMQEIIDEIDTDTNLSDEQKNDKHAMLAEEMKDAQRTIDSNGRIVTVGSITEAVIIKGRIMSGLGLNGPAQVGNYLIGDVAGMQSDGQLWKSGNYPQSKKYTNKLATLLRFATPGPILKKAKDNHNLTNTILNDLGMFQNSANEIDNVLEIKYKNSVAKYVSNPLHIVGAIEKTIQRPQMLAMLADQNIIDIKDKDGNSFPIFNLENGNKKSPYYKKGVHPAFKLVDGVLELKEEFQTEANIATWIDRNSQEYADTFGEAGKIPTIIAKINGDYRETSNTLMKNNTLTAIMMTFKTWVRAHLDRRYGKEDGVIRLLHRHGRGTESTMITSMASLAHIVTAAAFWGPVAGIGVMSAITVASSYKFKKAQRMKRQEAVRQALIKVDKKEKRELQEDYTVAKYLWHDAKVLTNVLNFAWRGVKLGAAGSAKAIQQAPFMTKRYLTDEKIDKIIGLTPKEGESMDDYSKDKMRLHFLLTELGVSLRLLAYNAAAQYAFILVREMLANQGPEGEEEEEDDDLRVKRIEEEIKKAESVYYGASNMFTRYSSDANLLNMPINGIGRTLLVGNAGDSHDKFSQAFTAMDDILMGKSSTISKGKNEGKHRVLAKLEGLGVPKGLTDMGLGFINMSESDYTVNSILDQKRLTDKQKITRIKANLRLEYKEELVKLYDLPENSYMSVADKEAAINRDMDEMYPPLSEDDFNLAGRLVQNHFLYAGYITIDPEDMK